MIKLPGLFLCVAAAASFFCAAVVAAPTTDAAAARIKAKLEGNFAGAKVENVHPSPWPGLYEVVTNGDVVYVNEQATLLFSGRILDIDSKEDLTANRWNVLHPADFSKLPLDSAIKSVKGDGSRQLVVFADPFCPYCRRLEHDLAELDNVTIHTFLLPLEDIHPGASQQAAKIWCAPDRAAAWSGWMVQNTEPQGTASCDTQALGKIRDVATGLVINSTPTLFFADGHRVAGAVAKDRLEKEFAVAKTALAGAAHSESARNSK